MGLLFGGYGVMKERNKVLNCVVQYMVLVLLSIIFIFPFIYMLNKSLMTREEVNSLPVMFFPSALHWENYEKCFDAEYIGYFKNTMIILLFNVIVIPFASSFCAYGFARCKFHGRDVMFMVVLSTIMLPGVVLQVPLYIIFNNLNWLNTALPLTVPNILGGGVTNIFLVRQYIRSLPVEIDNAAKIDGANRFQIYLRIILPLVVPVLTLIAVNTIIACWSDFSGPLIYIRRSDAYTLALGIYYKFSGGDTSASTVNLQMALSVLTTLPMVVLFFCFQSKIIGGVAISGLKA